MPMLAGFRVIGFILRFRVRVPTCSKEEFEHVDQRAWLSLAHMPSWLDMCRMTRASGVWLSYLYDSLQEVQGLVNWSV